MTPRLTMLKPNIATIDTRRGAPVAVERIRGGRLRKIRERIMLRDGYVCQVCGREHNPTTSSARSPVPR